MSLPLQSDTTIRFPRLIDCHVHFREPGLEQKGTMRSEAAAAKAGGVGIVCEMPNTDPPTVTIAALADKVRRAAEVDDCGIRFFFGVTDSVHLRAIEELWTGTSADMRRLKARCPGVKIYLDHSTGNQKVNAGLLDDVFQTCGRHGIPVVAHCEDAEMNARLQAENARADVGAHSFIRPPESEAKAIGHAITFAKKHGSRLHIAHLSTRDGVELVRRAKADGLPVTCEVAPHHVFLTTDDYAALGTFAKMNPPLRTRDHVEALWAGIADGTVDCIATDHAPHTIEEKRSSNPLDAPSGVPGVETMLPLLLTVALGGWPHPASARPAACALTMNDIVRLCFTHPNHIFSLGASDEEVLAVDPDAEWTIRGKDLHSKCQWTPYEGWNVKGKIVEWLAVQAVMMSVHPDE
ncbi:MAG: dihydroorotase [Candidatus Peregrinibacteria bacterium Greene0416_19]|nr:MAG: dihydroorotase [Candidatus Peregrinibacteria bacterium Greene0416_19]